MSAETFPNSRVRHGTVSGWTYHTKGGERPCDACYAAKQTYDHRRREGTAVQLRNRAHAKAQSIALRRLKREHPDEYARYYRDAKSEVLAESVSFPVVPTTNNQEKQP